MTHWAVWCITTGDWYQEDGEVWLGDPRDCVLKAQDLGLQDYETQGLAGRSEPMRYEIRPFKSDT